MMGHSHATSGALAWYGLAPIGASLGLFTLDTPAYLVGGLVCAGMALLPDLDHPDSTIARFYGPASNAVSHMVATVSGGHRKGTHTLLFVVLSIAAAIAIVTWAPAWAPLLLVFVSASLAFRALNLAPKGGTWSWLGILAESLAVTAAVAWFSPGTWAWLPWAVGLGVLLHLLGDALTTGGVPFLGPIWWRRFSLPVISRTGNWVEIRLLTPVMTLAAVLLVYHYLATRHGLPHLQI